MSYRSMRRTLRSYLKSYIKKKKSTRFLLSLPFSRQQIFSPNSHALTNSQWRAHAHTLSHCRIWDWLKNESDVFQRLQTEQMLKAPWRFVGVKEKMPCSSWCRLSSLQCIWRTHTHTHRHIYTHIHTLSTPTFRLHTHLKYRPTPSFSMRYYAASRNGRSSSEGGKLFW